MDLEPTEDQRLLGETVRELLDKHYGIQARLSLLRGENGWSRDLWSRYAEVGLLGLPFGERYGGAGMGLAEIAVVVEEFGRALVLEPYLATVALGGRFVALAGSEEQKQAILPALSAGDLLLAFAGSEPGRRWSLSDPATRATRRGDSWAISGSKSGVLGGDCADRLVVLAARPDDEDGLFLVDTDHLARTAYRQQDGLGAADVELTDAPAELLGAADVVPQVLDEARALLCAEAVGAMDRMLWLTVDYLKCRRQFGTPIAAFQALQHRAADMYVSYELARGMATLAVLAAAGDDPAQRALGVRAAKVQIDRSARHVGQESIQLHGGIGMSMEYAVGHYFKRTEVIGKTLGDTDLLLAEIAAAGGLVDE